MSNDNQRSQDPARQPLPVQPGETWGQYVDRLRSGPMDGSHMAGILSAMTLMRNTPEALANGKLLEPLSERLLRNPSFALLTKDRKAQELAAEGRGAELLPMLAEKQRLRRQAMDRMGRSAQQAPAEAEFLQTALHAMKDGAAAKGAPMKERERLRFQEMIRRMEYAQSLAEKGIALDGKTARELTAAVRNYNDGGKKIPGGKKEAAASRAAMCVLKHYLPEQEFNSYCADINAARGLEKQPSHPSYADPQAYSREVLQGSARPAKELMAAARQQLTKGMTLDGCAAAAAIQKLSGGNPNTPISQQRLQTEIGRMKSPGSAFLRAMEDGASRGSFAALASQGQAAKLGSSILRASKTHSIRAAQWQINQSVKGLAAGGPQAEGHLAGILAARSLAAESDPGQQITNKAFQGRAQQIRSSPEFAKLAARYRQEPAFRNGINRGISDGDGGKRLMEEYQRINSPSQIQAPTASR